MRRNMLFEEVKRRNKAGGASRDLESDHVPPSAACREATTIGLIQIEGYTYPFGVDPAWHGSTSELPFLNSLKMKMSIILGVTQMMVGIILSYMNAAYFKNSINILSVHPHY